jgi:hypothetical protein
MCRQHHHPPSASFASRDLYRAAATPRKPTNVASEHHFSCLLKMTCRMIALARVATDRINQLRKIGVKGQTALDLVNVFVIIALIYLRAAPRLGSLTPGRGSFIGAENPFGQPGPIHRFSIAYRDPDAFLDGFGTVLEWN